MTPFQKHVQAWKCCTLCQLSICRKNVVLARGTVPADVAFVGEAPGESEDVIGQPFVGPAGKLLSNMVQGAIMESGSPPPRIVWTNLVGCIPKDKSSHRKRGEPLPEEIIACHTRLEEFLAIAKPKLVVAVGELSKKQAMAHGWENRFRVVAVVHPAAILRADISSRGLLIQRVIVQLANAFADLAQKTTRANPSTK